MPRNSRLALPFIALALLAGCGGAQPGVRHAALPQSADPLIVVGRIELVPALTPDERRLRSHDPRLANKVRAVFSDRPLDLAALPIGVLPAHAVLELGEDFMLRVPRGPHLYYLGGIVLAGMQPAPGYSGRPLMFDDRELRLPGGFVVRVLPSDKAIYVGTLRYVRDGFGALRPLQVIDDYDGARRELARTLGAETPLRDVVPLIPR